MAATDDDEASTADLAAWISGHRREMLQAIRFHDGQANTSEIKEYSNVRRGSFDHHIDKLLSPPQSIRETVDWMGDEGLIEETGRVDVGSPMPARQFALTGAGKKAFQSVIDDVSVRASDVRDLQQRVEELERVESEVAELKEENETLKESFNHMADVVENLIDENDLASSV